MVLPLGVSCTSFAKSELLAGKLLGTLRWMMAIIDSAEYFLPRMAALARSLVPERPRPLAITSDCAEWITQGVPEHLPGWRHIADYWHACQHIHKTGERCTANTIPRHGSGRRSSPGSCGKWGAEKLADLLRPLAMGAMLRSLRRTRRSAEGPTIGLASIRRLEDAGVLDIALLSATPDQELARLGVRPQFIGQLRA